MLIGTWLIAEQRNPYYQRGPEAIRELKLKEKKLEEKKLKAQRLEEKLKKKEEKLKDKKSKGSGSGQTPRRWGWKSPQKSESRLGNALPFKF